MKASHSLIKTVLGSLIVLSIQAKSIDELKIFAIRLNHTDNEAYYSRNGEIYLQHGTITKIKVIGTGLKDNTSVLVTTGKQKMGSECNFVRSNDKIPRENITAIAPNNFLFLSSSKLFPKTGTYYLCLERKNSFIHQGTEKRVSIKIQSRQKAIHLPIWGTY